MKNKKKNRIQIFKKVIRKTIIYGLITVISVITLVVIALQFPFVQTALARKATEILSEKLDFPVSIEAVNIDWFDAVTLKGVSIKDRSQKDMIDVKTLYIDFNLWKLIRGEPEIQETKIENARVELTKDRNTRLVNITEFVEAVKKLTQSKKKTPDSKSKNTEFLIKRIQLIDSYFSFSDEAREKQKEGFDGSHFAFENIQAKITRFNINGGTFEMDIKSLSCREDAAGLGVENITTLFRVTGKSMEFRDMAVSTGKSRIKDELIFSFDNINDMGKFMEKVTITSHLNESLIYAEDLAIFAPKLKKFGTSAVITADVQGTVDNFRTKNLDVRLAGNSRIRGALHMEGLPDIEKTYIRADLTNSVVRPADIRSFTDNSVYERVKKIGNINLNTVFTGYLSKFKAEGVFNTDIGRLESNVDLSLKKNPDFSTYSGSIKTTDFKIGEILGKKSPVREIDMQGEIKGTGFDINKAVIDLNAHIDRIRINGYDYKNVDTDARLGQRIFEGKLSVADTNLVMNVDGNIELRDDASIFEVKVKVKKSELHTLNITKEYASFRSGMVFNFTGNTIDEIEGSAGFFETYLAYKDRDITIDKLTVFALRDSLFHIVDLRSDLIDVNVTGDFKFTRIVKDAKRLWKEYQLNFKNNTDSLDAYYTDTSVDSVAGYKMDYTVNIKNINPLTDLFIPGTFISNNTELEGSFSRGNTSALSLYGNIDTLIYSKYEFYGSEIDVATSKLSNQPDVLASGFISSEKQVFKNIQTEKLYLEGLWNGQNIDFIAKIEQDSGANTADMSGNITFLPDLTRISLGSSQIKALNQLWTFQGENRVDITKTAIAFENFELVSGNQRIALNGTLSDDPSDEAEVIIENTELAAFSSIVNMKIGGAVSGRIKLQNVYKEPDIESNLVIRAFTADDFLVGDLRGLTSWNNQTKRLNVLINVDRFDEEVINITGYYDHLKEKNPLNLTANLNNTNLEILQPFLKSVFSDISGTAKGKLRLKGSPRVPILEGKVKVTDGRLRVDYLNTLYSFNDNITFETDRIVFSDMKLIDVEGNKAVINGGIYHNGFRDYVIDLSGTLDRFNVLNTDSETEESYYGIANVSGKFNMVGIFSDLLITADARTEKGTKIYIPVSGTSSFGEKDYITFVKEKPSEKDTLQSEQKSKTKGIQLDFNLEITPDAYAEIIFDLRAGDIIRGNGRGRLKLEIDTRGEFNMFGNFEIVKGAYNFTLANIINKEFKIKQGSAIRWSGDPFDGLLDITASYQQNVSLLPILTNLDSAGTASPELRRRYPAIVNLYLTDRLSSPKIDFGIEISGYPSVVNTGGITYSLQSDVLAFKSRISNDEQEMNRQVFSLMVLQRLSEYNSFNLAGSAAAGSVSELLTNQLSNWMSQVDENLQVDIDLSGFTNEDLESLQVRLSYSLLDGRLRVTREGGFTNYENKADVSSIVGDWTLEYLLNEKGNLRIKMYNKNNRSSVEGLGNAGSTAGFSIVYTISFNSLKELFSKKKTVIESPVRLSDDDSEEPVIEEEFLNLPPSDRD